MKGFGGKYVPPRAMIAVTLAIAVLGWAMKQAIVVRTDVGMGTGKLAAQVAHASLSAVEQADSRRRDQWKRGGQKKVVLDGESERQLHELATIADQNGLPNAIIRDAGHTQLEPGTVTALAIGPAAEDAIDRVTGELSLL